MNPKIWPQVDIESVNVEKEFFHADVGSCQFKVLVLVTSVAVIAVKLL